MAEHDSSDGHRRGCHAEKREGCWLCDPFGHGGCSGCRVDCSRHGDIHHTQAAGLMTAQLIAIAILRDLGGRAGFSLDGVDVAVQREIVADWTKLIDGMLP